VNDSKIMKGLVSSITRISFIIMIFTVIPFFMIDSYGIEGSDLTELKEEKEEVKNDIKDLEKNIIEHQKIIKNFENELLGEKSILRELIKDDDDSWGSIEKIYYQKITIKNIEKELSDENDKLLSLTTEKLKTTQSLDDIEKQIKDIEDDSINNKLKDNKSDITIIKDLERKIGITISNTCIQMIKNNIESTCPSYEELYLLDSSNEYISGKFVTDDNGFFHRGFSPITNSWKWYDFDNNLRLFIDPPTDMKSHIKLIEIKHNFDTYTINGNLTQPSQYTDKETLITNNLNQTETITTKIQTQQEGRIVYHDVYVDKHCWSAIINSDRWEEILDSVILHLRKNCDEELTIPGTIEFIPAIKTEIDITTSPHWQYQQWLKEVQIKCKVICSEY